MRVLPSILMISVSVKHSKPGRVETLSISLSLHPPLPIWSLSLIGSTPVTFSPFYCFVSIILFIWSLISLSDPTNCLLGISQILSANAYRAVCVICYLILELTHLRISSRTQTWPPAPASRHLFNAAHAVPLRFLHFSNQLLQLPCAVTGSPQTLHAYISLFLVHPCPSPAAFHFPLS